MSVRNKFIKSDECLLVTGPRIKHHENKIPMTLKRLTI